MKSTKMTHQRVPLTAEDLAELDRRKSNAVANRAIMALREELRGLKLALDILILGRFTEIESDDDVKGLDLAIRILKVGRVKRLAEIKTLEASKRKQGAGGA